MSPLSKLKSLYSWAIYGSTALRLPALTALLVASSLTTIRTATRGNPRTVVILPKEGFTEDILAALALAPDINVVAFPRAVLQAIASRFLPYFVDENNYASCGPQFDEVKLRYRKFLAAMLQTLRRIKRIDAIVSGNFAYAADRELASASKELGLPFIVLHKENLKTEGRVAFFERIYAERRGPFTGHKVLVYNRIEHDLQIRAGIVEPSGIEIVGMPRLDRLHAWRRENAGSTVTNRILFFVFTPVTGMPRVIRKTGTPGRVYFEERDNDDAEDISLARLSTGTCRALLQLARENPDISIAVKTKGRGRDFTETPPLFGVDSEAQLPANLRIVHGGDVLPLIADASVVCGFNSTALLEAVAAGKPVVMPWFGEAELPEVWPYLIDLQDICVTARGPKEFYRLLREFARHPRPVPADLDPKHKECLALWTGNDDGHAAARTLDAIVRQLNSSEILTALHPQAQRA